MDLRRLTTADAARYRALMLQAYADEPAAFTATVAEREPLPLDWWEARIGDRPPSDSVVLGGFEGMSLLGAAGLRVQRRPRTAHKATLFGLVVRPEARGCGIGRTLIEAVVDRASAADIRVIGLTVMETNAAAIHLYESCGFAAFGTAPMAVRLADGFVGGVHMTRQIPRPGV